MGSGVVRLGCGWVGLGLWFELNWGWVRVRLEAGMPYGGGDGRGWV